jgi:hypothetical protein
MYLGKTELPMDVIEEYLDSLREIYTVDVRFLSQHALLSLPLTRLLGL